jgi:hypothetical protein
LGYEEIRETPRRNAGWFACIDTKPAGIAVNIDPVAA